MNNNYSIFEKLNQESDGEDFSFISDEKQPTSFSQTLNAEPQEGKNIFETLNEQKEAESFGFLDKVRDVAEQVVSKGVSGVAGAYGNILDAVGLQPKEGEQTPAQQARNEREFEILEKMNRGEKPSFSELMELSEDYGPSRLPTSKEVQKGIEYVTGIGEGKTPIGRIAGRGAEFVGEGVMTGGGAKALATLGGAGVAGQSVREVGGPEGLATGVEIAGSILPSIIEGRLVPKVGSATGDLVEGGRRIGLTEKQITPLIQSEKKAATLAKVARKSTKTKELFTSIKESLGDSYSTIKQSVSKMGRVSPQHEKNLIQKFTDIKTDLQRTLKPSPDKEAAINFISEAIEKIQKSGASPEEMINFWQDVNKSVNWNSIQGGKKSLARLKEPLLETLESVAPAAAKDFEITNKLYSKYAQISKKLKPDVVDAIVSKGELFAALPSGYALSQGNPWPLISLGGEAAIRTLAEEMLTNPYFQNLAAKLVTNFNSSSAKGVTDLVGQAKDYMTRKYPNEDWSFLTQD